MRLLILILFPVFSFGQITINGGGPGSVSINNGGPGSVKINYVQMFPVSLFNSATDNFTEWFGYTADGELSVTSSQIVYSGTTDKNVRLLDDNGSLALLHQYEYWTMSITFTAGAMSAGDEGFEIGLSQGSPGIVAGFRWKCDPAIANRFELQPEAESTNAGAAVTGNDYTPGETMTMTVSRNLNTLSCSVDGITSHVILGAAPYSTYLLPGNSTSFLLRFNHGSYTVNAMSISLPDSDFPYLFVGNSITQGKIATQYNLAYAQKLKAAFPRSQMFAGRGSRTNDIIDMLPAIIELNPQNVCIMIGINDIITGVSMANIQSRYTTILNTLATAGINVILISTMPNDNSTIGDEVASLNTWLQSNFSGLQYIDVFSVVKDGGANTMQAALRADGTHPNDAGMQLIYETILSEL